MHSRRTVHKQLRPILLQRRQPNLHPPLKNLRSLRLEIVVHRIPANRHPMRPRQRRVVELDLHVDDVRNSRPRHRRHVLRVPDPTPDRDPVRQPCNIHSHSASSDLSLSRKVPGKLFRQFARRKYFHQPSPRRFHTRRNRQHRRFPPRPRFAASFHSTASSPPHLPRRPHSRSSIPFARTAHAPLNLLPPVPPRIPAPDKSPPLQTDISPPPVARSP